MVGLILIPIMNIGKHVLPAVEADTGRRHQHWVLVPIAVDNLIAKADGRVMLVIKQAAHLQAIQIYIMRILGYH